MISGDKLIYNMGNVVKKQPITADLFLTNFCNNHCVYCTYKRWDLPNSLKKFVSFEDFKKNVEILQKMGVKGFILTGGGEPCINPDFDKITKWLEDNDLQYGINTNFNVLKFIKPVYLKVSLDASSPEEYKKIRGVDTYELVIDNIKKYIDWKNQNEIKTKVGVQCVGITPSQILEFYQSVKDLKCDYIVIRPIESTCGSFYKDKNNEEMRKKCIKAITSLMKFDDRVILNYKWNETKTFFNSCSANCTQIAVNERNEVIYCCHKPFEVIGNLSDADIIAKRNNFKTDMSKCDVPCRLTAPNKIFDLIASKSSDYCFI